MMRSRYLYNVMLPLWLLLVFPQLWGISLLLSFVVDILVLAAAMKYYAVGEIRRNARRSIFRVWISGLVADLIGLTLLWVGVMLPMIVAAESWWVTTVCEPLMMNPWASMPALLYMTVCIGVTAVAIYQFNSRWALCRVVEDEERRNRIARAMAVFTTPYLFYLPTTWFYAW